MLSNSYIIFDQIHKFLRDYHKKSMSVYHRKRECWRVRRRSGAITRPACSACRFCARSPSWRRPCCCCTAAPCCASAAHDPRTRTHSSLCGRYTATALPTNECQLAVLKHRRTSKTRHLGHS